MIKLFLDKHFPLSCGSFVQTSSGHAFELNNIMHTRDSNYVTFLLR